MWCSLNTGCCESAVSPSPLDSHNYEPFLDSSDLNFWLTNRISQAWQAYKNTALCLEKTDYRLSAAALCLFNYVVFQLFAEHWGGFTLYFFIPSDHIPPQKQESKESSTRTIRFTLYWEFPDCGQEAPTYLFYQGIESYLYYLKWILSIECHWLFIVLLCVFGYIVVCWCVYMLYFQDRNWDVHVTLTNNSYFYLNTGRREYFRNNPCTVPVVYIHEL